MAATAGEAEMTSSDRRYVCRLIDLAVDRCEEGNLRDQLELPRWVADLAVQLQAVTGGYPQLPHDTIAAHGQLLDLRELYMPDPPDGPRERNVAGPACAGCGRQMTPNCRHVTCSSCRPLERAAARAAHVLGRSWP